MHDLTSLFIRHLKFNLRFSENTISSYSLDIKIFLEYLLTNYDKGLNLIQILSLLKPEDYRKYLSYKIHERKCSARTNARTISALKCFFKFLVTGNYIEANSIMKLKFPKLPKLMPKSLEEDEMLDLMTSLGRGDVPDKDENHWKNLRNEALTFLIYSTGLRISESLALNKKDFMKNSNFLRIAGKGGKERMVPILEEAKVKIRAYLNQIPQPLFPDHPLFITEKSRKKTGAPQRLSPREFQKIIQDSRMQLSMPSFTTPHAFRHSFATHIINHGGQHKECAEFAWSLFPFHDSKICKSGRRSSFERLQEVPSARLRFVKSIKKQNLKRVP